MSGLPPALAGERRTISFGGQRLAIYLSQRCVRAEGVGDTPLVLIHSINAAASAAEVKPLFDRYAAGRAVLALELPGFGSSDRVDRRYEPALMKDAILTALAYLKRLGLGRAADVMAVSLSCEFLARAAIERPDRFRSIALVSPTGLEGWRRESYRAGATRGNRWLLAVLRCPVWSRALFSVLTSRASLRWFLRRAWGSHAINAELLEYDHMSARQPGARFAPFAFIAGALFTRGVAELYRRLSMPVWFAYGDRGGFGNCEGVTRLGARARWRRDRFATGVLPYFEAIDAFGTRYDAFLAGIDGRTTGSRSSVSDAGRGPDRR